MIFALCISVLRSTGGKSQSAYAARVQVQERSERRWIVGECVY